MKFVSLSCCHVFVQESTQGHRKGVDGKEMPTEISQTTVSQDQIPTDTSDTTESDEDKNQSKSLTSDKNMNHFTPND